MPPSNEFGWNKKLVRAEGISMIRWKVMLMSEPGNRNPCIILVKFSRYFLDLTMNLDWTFFGFNAMFRNSTKFYHKLSRIKHFMSHRLAQSPSCQIGLKLFFVLILAVSNHLDGILCLISRRPLDWMKTKMRIGWWWCYRWIEQSTMMASMC